MEALVQPQKTKQELDFERFLGFLNKGTPPYDYERQLFNNHNDRMRAILEGKIVPPYEVEIQPSSLCNLECKHCFGSFLTTEKIPNKIGGKEMRTLIQRIDDFRENGFKVDTVKFCGTTGEPLVNPHTLNGIDYAKELGKEVILFTNGLLLDKEYEGKQYLDYVFNVDKLVLSLDAGTDETFRNLKGKDGFSRIINGLEKLVRKKDVGGHGPKIVIGYVVGEDNYHEIISTTQLMKDIGVDEIKFRVDFVNTGDMRLHSKQIIQNLSRAQDYSTDDFKAISVYSDETIDGDDSAFNSYGCKCFNQNFWACIGPDAKLYACGHRTYDGVEPYGDLLESSFKDLWISEKRVKGIKELPDKHCSICSTSSSRRNEFMTFLKNSDIKF